MRHYNEERPNQALSCGNRPPRVAFPALSSRPPLPAQVDPDGWLRLVDGRHYVRKVRGNGTVRLDEAVYYVQQHLAGQYVTLQIDAANRALVVHQQQQAVKHLPLKGLHAGPLALDDYTTEMCRQARSWRAGQRYRGPSAQAA